MIHIIAGDSRSLLKQLPDKSISCCVTSPPYFGLRDYGTASWTGGNAQCSHRPDDTPSARGITLSTLGGGKDHTGHRQEGFKSGCPRCGAQRTDSQIGLEKTPELYVTELVELFREVRRILRDDGTLWLNLGDSYANDTKWGGSSGGKHARALHGATSIGREKVQTGLKSKDLIGIPWRVAFALQQDGWYLRQDIIWHKPNPMPESVQDRCTKAHEYIFLLSKSPKYFFDSKAMQEPASKGAAGSKFYSSKTGEHQLGRASTKPRKRNSTNESFVPAAPPHGGIHREGVEREPEFRNRRSVWIVSTKPFKEAHFATFPPELITPCILAGCPEGGIVLDPFGGAGTTGLVAKRHSRNAILFELNPGYAEMARRRIDNS